MALTVTANIEDFGSKTGSWGTILGDSSYPTNGESLTPQQLKLKRVVFFIAEPSGGYVPQFDYANNKLKVYYGDNNNASDGPLIEAANGTNLSAITFRYFAIGE